MRWRRSSRCDSSNCVEVAIVYAVTEWKKSSLSGYNGGCVEVGVWKTSSLTDNSGPWCVEVTGAKSGDVLVRDTKDKGEGPVLRYTAEEWRAFIGGVKLGEFDLD